MIYLLDVSSLLALLWTPHVHHRRVTEWQSSVELAVCAITELGFVRISTQPGFDASVADAMKMLRDWKHAKKPRFVDCDLEVLAMKRPPTGNRTTDFYLASLASKHGLRFATLDEDVKHEAAFLIPT